jgi:roadblock/LC7 domain-containing protein
MASGNATLGYEGGPSITFRINPNSIQWNFQVNTFVQPTVGGRVVQVNGATLNNIELIGSYGEVKAGQTTASKVSWELAEQFLAGVRLIMDKQAEDASVYDKMQPPPVFNFPLKGWRFSVYLLAIEDPKGGAITHSPDHFSHEYKIVLFIVEDLSQSVVKVGKNGVIGAKKQEAINNYISRLSDGVGWVASEYNGPGRFANKPGEQDYTNGGQLHQQSSKTQDGQRTR